MQLVWPKIKVSAFADHSIGNTDVYADKTKAKVDEMAGIAKSTVDQLRPGTNPDDVYHLVISKRVVKCDGQFEA